MNYRQKSNQICLAMADANLALSDSYFSASLRNKGIARLAYASLGADHGIRAYAWLLRIKPPKR